MTAPSQDPLEALSALVRAHGDAVPLDRALVEVARVDRPALERRFVFEELDRLAERVRAAGIEPSNGGLEALRQVLFDEEGFRGNREGYYEPENSFLDRVLERRRGIPISLAAVWLEVARRLGLEAAGVGFPGHFLVRHRTGSVWRYVDAFDRGRILELEDVRDLLRSVHGRGAELDPSMLAPVSARSILVRFAHNLKNAYALQKDRLGIVASIGRLLAVAPELHHERRDRGLIYAQMGLAGSALADLRTYLAEAEVPPRERAALERLLPDLQSRLGQMN